SFNELPRLELGLELETNRQLRLARVAYAHAQEAVKVEERRRYERVHIVFVVEGVEHLDGRDNGEAVAELKRARRSPIEGNVFIVVARRIALAPWCCGAIVRGNGLRSVGLKPAVKIEPTR